MGRAFAVSAAFALVGLVGWLAGSSREAPAPARTLAPRADPLAEFRLAEIERRIGQLEALLRREEPSRPPEQPARPGSGQAGTAATRASADEIAGTAFTAAAKREWLDRYRLQQSVADRLEVLRAASAHTAPGGTTQGRRGFFEEVLASTTPGSDEWAQASFGLGYLAREDRDFAASDACFTRVQDAAPRDSASHAMAGFQLGWNRKFAGDARASEAHFRAFLVHPAAAWGTKAAARYAIANTRLEEGDLAGARAELEALLADADAQRGGGTEVAYWRNLAKTALAAAVG